MKTMKFFMLASAFASMIGFSSCLNGDGYSGSYTVGGIAKVNGFTGMYYFTGIDGSKIQPASQEGLDNRLSGNPKYAQIIYQYDPSTASTNGKEMMVQMVNCLPILEGQVINTLPVETQNDTIVPFVYNSTVQLQPTFFTRTDLMLPISFYVHQDVMGEYDTYSKELALHHFNLYYEAEKDFKNGKMTLHLRHATDVYIAGDDDKNKGQGKRDYLFNDYRYFSIAAPMYEYMSLNGDVYPSHIIIKFEQVNDESDYTDKEEDGTYEFDYTQWKEFFDEMEKNKSGDSSDGLDAK